MKMTKDGVIEEVTEQQLKKYLAYGWQQMGLFETESEVKVKAIDEVIRLKPTVRNKTTVTVLAEANNKGDE